MKIQAQWRGFMVQSDYIEFLAARELQAWFRSKVARNSYLEYKAARCIQSHARKMVAVRDLKEYLAAQVIQSWYRCQSIHHDYHVFVSARKIQAQWRGFEARRVVGDELWLRDDAATTIQKTWRMFYQFSNYTILSFEKHAATTIQKYWRRFWQSSHYVILRYEITRIQSFIRGYQQRQKIYHLNHYTTLIQSSARSFMARKNCHMERLIAAMVQSASISLSTRLASKRIQRWYRLKSKESMQKKAALKIERFFIWVRKEVEVEIERREKMKLVKRQKQRRKRTDEEDTLLESVWNNTLDEKSTRKSKSKGRQKLRSGSKRGKDRKKDASKNSPGRHQRVDNILSSPTKQNFYDPHDADQGQLPPTTTVNMAFDYPDTHSDVSGLTTPSVFVPPVSRVKMRGQDLEDDLDLEEAWLNASQIKRVGGDNMGRKKSSVKRTDSSKENGDISNRLDHIPLEKNRVVPLEPSRRVHRDILKRG